ncbi:MAG: hypothetical protein WAT74_16255 [Flavobacteriales bacterium]
MNAEPEVLLIVRELLSAVRRLEALYDGRKFTLDGHLVGSIGEVLAAQLYGLKLLPPSTEGHDAEAEDGRLVQVKLTQTQRVSIYSKPEYLIVLRLGKEGSIEEVFNGPGAAPWAACGKPQKNGQRAISLARLRVLVQQVQPMDRLERRINPDWLKLG